MLVNHNSSEIAIDIKYRLAKLGKTQRQLAKLFKKTEAQISNAIRGYADPKLLNKIISYIEKLEGRQ